MDKPSPFEITIQGLPELPNKLRTMHWGARSRHNKKWREMTSLLAIAKRNESFVRGRDNAVLGSFKPIQHAMLVLIRGSATPADRDGIISSFKPIIDGIVDAGIILGDGPTCVREIRAEWELAEKKKGYVKIIVEPFIF